MANDRRPTNPNPTNQAESVSGLTLAERLFVEHWKPNGQHTAEWLTLECMKAERAFNAVDFAAFEAQEREEARKAAEEAKRVQAEKAAKAEKADKSSAVAA